MVRIVSRCCIALVGVVATTQPALSQQHAHSVATPEQLGAVHFSTSCSPSVAPTFDRAIALLHSFEFGASIGAFQEVLKSDSTCAMAHWGIAMSRWTNPMAVTARPAATLDAGRQSASAATHLASGATERERAYIAAVSQLFADYDRVPHRDRVVNYERAMAVVASNFPADTEAKIFHALALIAAAPPTDKSYAKQREGGATLEALWARQPSHPGLAHYIIHAYDVPALAPLARRAAARYAAIAPSAAHALHMPSHTFTRVGMWKESARTNLRSIEAARSSSSFGEMLHASDYMMYAYLQMRSDSLAHDVLDRLPAIQERFDPNAITGAAPGSAGVFALAAIPARWVLERRAWNEAASLSPHSTSYPYAEAMTYLARSLGASRIGDTALARASVDSLVAIAQRLASSGEAYWAEQVVIQSLEGKGALAMAQGRADEGLAAMREACTREDATEKSAVTPGPLIPAHELLGDVYLDLKRPAEALAQYRLSMAKEPNRFRTLYGAMRAARQAGDRAAAKSYALQLERLTGSTSFSRDTDARR